VLSRLTINRKIQAVALIGVLGFVSYFLWSIKSNYQYQTLFEDLSQNDLQILELSNEVNLQLNKIESITQASSSREAQLSAKALMAEMNESYQTLHKLDKRYRTEIIELDDLSERYAGLLIDLSSGELSSDAVRKQRPLVESLEQDLRRLRDEYRAKRVSLIEEKIQRSKGISGESLRFGFIVGLLLTLFMLLLARHFAKGVTETLDYVSQIAGKISQGKWDVKIQSDTSDETAEVLQAMEKMRDALKVRSEEDAQREDEQKRLMDLAELGRGEMGTLELCQAIMRQLSKTLEAQVGAMYLVEEHELQETQALKLIASYAFVQRKGISDRFEFGEGIIGQVALEKTQVMLSEVPENYLSITSALGEGSPSFVVVTPLLFNEHLYGVIEFGFIREPSLNELAFLMKAGEAIAQYVESIKARENVRIMLGKTQEQAEKLEHQQEILQAANEDLESQAMALTESESRLLSQQEELRVSNEELEEQAKALKLSEERLQAQQEELRVTNEELEEHARALEKQKKEMQVKNDELEESRQVLEEKTKALELSGQYKSEFMSTMSHELRTPLNSILILSENLSDNDGKNLTDKQVEHAKVIKKAGGDLLSLINDILDLAKVEEGKLELLLDEVSFEEWANDMNLLFSPVAERKGIEFSVTLADSLQENLTTDVKRLNQILKNLLSNALKFTEEGSVRLEVTEAPSDLKLTDCECKPEELIGFSVVDSGVGIEPDKQSLIFEAFQQSDGAISRKFGGTGLGLTISNRLAKLLGGEITVSSEGLGYGSTFTVYIPKDAPDNIFSEDVNLELLSTNDSEETDFKEADQEETEEVYQEENNGSSSNTILIVEDDPVFSETLSLLAREYGLDVVLAADGETALELAKKEKPQGIILDLMLPGIGGIDVMEALRADRQTKDIPVHVMSGKEGKEGEARAMSMGAIDFLKKPVSKDKIVELLGNFQKDGESIKQLLVIEAAKGKSFAQVKALFSKQGVKVKSLSSIRGVIDNLSKRSFDCIIFDLDFLREGKGESKAMEALAKIHQALGDQNTPIIVCTHNEIDRDQEAKLRKYADRIILKSNASEERLVSEASLFLHWLGDTPEAKVNAPVGARDELFEGKRVLIVDDDMRNVYSLTSELERHGMQVEAADSGLECLDMLQSDSETFDMVLMDIMMPGMDGFSTIEKIRSDQHFESLPIIVLTAKSLKEDRARCLELGANDYLSKPIDVERLMALMRVWMT
jgi:CheY-like chemotaxis protein